jgi:hypothetical protein
VLKLSKPAGAGVIRFPPVVNEPKALREYLRQGRVSWLESVAHTKPECLNYCQSMVTLKSTGDGNRYRFWVCWGCGNIIYDDKPESRQRSIEEQHQLLAEVKEYLSQLTTEQELCLYRHATSDDIMAWEERKDCFE